MEPLTPTTPTGPQYYPPAPPPKPKSLVPFLAAAVVVVLAVGVWAYFRAYSGPSPEPSGSALPSESATPLPGGGEAHVKWHEWEKLANLKYLPFQPYDPSVPDSGPADEYYRIGTFSAGPYAGSDLILARRPSEMGGGYVDYRFVRTASGSILLTRESADFWQDPSSPAPPFRKDASYAIPDLKLPAFLSTPFPGFAIRRADDLFFVDRTWADLRESELQKAFDTPYGTVWTDTLDATPTPAPGPGVDYYGKYYGFYLRRPDGFIETYVPQFSFIGESTVNVRWSDDGFSRGEYIAYESGGCGRSNFLAVVQPTDINPSRDLKQVGTTTDAQLPVYALTNDRHPLLEQAFTNAPDYVRNGADAYANFLRSHPIFFWKDPLGRYIKFQAKDIIPPAECGKPVIYLYPERTSGVSVRVEPVGGMSVSEPAYGDGWTVTAQPDGTLTDAAGRVWPYLFWEGTGGLYRAPVRGWSVAREEVPHFLDERLAQLGLSPKETADFKEFWVPRMQEAPYYFVGFHGNRVMDALAPLTVSPQPDTIIRVLMDFMPLQRPVDAQPPVIRTPQRSGFTVVEWGGVIR